MRRKLQMHLLPVQTLIIRLEHEPAAAVVLLVQALHVGHVDLGVQTVLDAHLQRIVNVGRLVRASATVFVAVRHC